MRIISRGLCGLFAAAWLSGATALAESLTLVEDGRSPYRIVIAEGVSDSTTRAASELQRFVTEISGAKLPIDTDRGAVRGHEIILGDNAHSRALKPGIELERLGEEGFAIRTLGPHLVIVGGPARGTLYGVYSFLEDHLGCRWYSSKVNRIPKRRTISVGPMDDTQTPAFEYREVYYHDAMDPEFAARHKLNGNVSVVSNGKLISERHRRWGLWCHSFFALVPPKKYFASHPEYFSLVGGKRVANKQLCLTNPEVLATTVASLKGLMAKAPDAHYWSVSQMDWSGYCTCEHCKAIDAREGTPMGSVLAFINKVAARFCDKTLSTLAYQYTRRPPKSVRPAKNVLINLCSIECNRSRPIRTDRSSASFRRDLKNWSAICDRLFVWDYVVQFKNLVSPFPNLRVLQPDMQLFAASNVVGVFSQGNREIHGEFCELRAYLLAKLQWNPNCDVERILNDFLTGYYGPAGKPIRKYIDLTHEALARSGKALRIFGNPQDHRDGYLSKELMGRYKALFDEAERLVAGRSDLLLRVRTARMPLMYAQLQLGFGGVDERAAVARDLFEVADRIGLRMFNEWNLPTERYKQDVAKALASERKAGK